MTITNEDALISIAQTLLRVRGADERALTSYHIPLAVDETSKMLVQTVGAYFDARDRLYADRELRRRYGLGI